MRTLANIALIAGYVFAAQTLGLFVSTGIYLVVHMLILGVRPTLAIPAAAGVALVIYGFFGAVLGVRMGGAWLI